MCLPFGCYPLISKDEQRYLRIVAGANARLLGEHYAEQEERVNLKGVAVRTDAIQDHAVVVLARERVDVREKHAEIRPEALGDVELAGRGEAGEAADQRVHAVEHVLLLHAEQLLVGEIERHACPRDTQKGLTNPREQQKHASTSTGTSTTAGIFTRRRLRLREFEANL